MMKKFLTAILCFVCFGLATSCYTMDSFWEWSKKNKGQIPPKIDLEKYPNATVFINYNILAAKGIPYKQIRKHLQELDLLPETHPLLTSEFEQNNKEMQK